MPDKGENPQSPDGQSPDGGRRRQLPPNTEVVPLFRLSEKNVAEAIKENISPKGKQAPVATMVHGRARVWIAGSALAIALIGPCTPWVPDNIKTGFLTIAGSISASLFKGFESN